MKYIYTLLAVLACVTNIHAQKLSFQYDGKNVENGSTIISDKINEQIFQFLGGIQFEPHITVTSDTEANVTIKAESLDGQNIELCYVGCENATTITQTSKVAANTATEIRLHAGGMMLTGTLTYKVRLTAYCEGKESETISIEVWMTNDDAVLSTESIEDKKDVVTVEGRTLCYSLSKAASMVKIYTLTGSQQLSLPLKGTEGKVSLSNLTPGVYLYLIDGNKRKVGKFLIQ